jgi:uncharacterized protein
MSERSEYAKPLPSLDDEVTAPYWKAATEHRLALPRCGECGAVFFYPRRFCPSCWSERIEWIDAAGTGTVWSFTFVHVPFYDETWAADVPYCVGLVQLDEGVRLATNIVGVGPGEVAIGDPVRAVFDDVTPEVTLPKFELVR